MSDQPEENPAIPAATVVLIRDGADGLETLMLRKNAALAFGGMWVFPGGRVDPGDGDGEEGARRAAARESREEADLVVDPDTLVPYAHWVPPPIAVKRFATWFFLAPAPEGGEVTIDMGEIHEHVWVTPATALDRHGEGEVELAPPTWVTLNRLAAAADVAAALVDAKAEPVEHFETHITKTKSGELIATWHGDVAYEGGDGDAPGPRHRLIMRKGRRWLYQRRC